MTDNQLFVAVFAFVLVLAVIACINPTVLNTAFRGV